MGNCKYCGKPSGFFSSKHAECEEKYLSRQRILQEGRYQIVTEVFSAIKGSDDLNNLIKKIETIEKSFSIPIIERQSLLAKGWESCVEYFLEDGILDITEERRLAEFKERFSLSQAELDINGALTKTAKAAVLRDVLNGTIPQRVSVSRDLSINLQKGEKIVWVFFGSKYLEDKTRRHYVGSSHGVSIRVMKGVYYRVGAFKGRPIEETERVHIDTGQMVTTNKNIYFVGPQKSVKLPYSKIISFEPFSDGIGMTRDAATAKPQIFVTGDGWFTFNLVTNLAKL